MFEHCYRTTDPAALAAHRAAVAALAEFTAWLYTEIATLNAGDLKPLSRNGAFGGPVELAGLEYVDASHVPWGWRVLNHKGKYRIEPKSVGAGSAAAKKWLEEHQPGPDRDPRYVLKNHGIAYQSRVHFTGGGFETYTPALFEHDAALWIWYRDGAPDGDFPRDPCQITWDRVPLADMQTAYAAAYEAATDRAKESV